MMTEACAEGIPTYVENMCQGMGLMADTPVSSLPNRCLAVGKGEAVESALNACEGSNIFTESWKLTYGLPNDAVEHFVAFGRDYGREPDGTLGSTFQFNFFMYANLACQQDADCHARLLEALDDDARETLESSAVYCDFGDGGDIEFDRQTVEFLTEIAPTGERPLHPVCRQFHCQFADCEGDGFDGSEGPFVFDGRWDQYYRERFMVDLVE